VIAVRVCGDGDVATIVALRRAWNEEDSGGPIDDAGFEARLAAWIDAERSKRTFFVAEVGGVAIGMANVLRYDRMPAAGRASAGWWGYVGNVFVLPAHRDAGVGALLMAHILEWARANGYERLRLAPSDRAKPFYERLGYESGMVVQLNP
jgi:GNAT superfamily N-acetyltransferase